MSYKAAVQAKNVAKEELPKTTIEAIDSRTGHEAQLLCVLEAAKAANEGKGIVEILDIVNELIPKLNLLYILDTVYYLGKGGRMGKADAWTDSALAAKSILEMDFSTGGIMTPVTRARTKTKAIEKLVEVIRKRNGNRNVNAIVSHDDVPEEAEKLKQLLLSQVPISEIYIAGVSPTTVIHDGPGALRLGWYSED
jgi:DegV family protein with EDD domain